jgi:hypothetical protein
MKTLNTDENNDLFLDGKNIALAYDVAAVGKVCEQIVQTQRGELQFDITRGIPWFETIFASIRYIKLWASDMVLAFEGVANVTGVTSFKYEISERNVKYVAQINSIYGKVALNG